MRPEGRWELVTVPDHGGARHDYGGPEDLSVDAFDNVRDAPAGDAAGDSSVGGEMPADAAGGELHRVKLAMLKVLAAAEGPLSLKEVAGRTTQRFAEGIVSTRSRRTAMLDGIVHCLGVALAADPERASPFASCCR